MTASPFIRRAGLTDVRSLWEIEKVSFPSPWSLWCFLAEYANSKSTILVAGPPPPEPWETWGYVIYWILADEMHLLNLAVHPDQRRRGIARSLLTAALTRLALRAPRWCGWRCGPPMPLLYPCTTLSGSKRSASAPVITPITVKTP